jgi:hypothetical protein
MVEALRKEDEIFFGIALPFGEREKMGHVSMTDEELVLRQE